ncbi:hypothetical protein HJP15_02530 [Pseudoalteromonas sp. NEC-BIFX-2020_002]|uniref:hypothetical protein n=1 Tax=Pseudoalteromonas sp. NEC-BIFX-2020_002 TaxID=2732353 RepID=UPI0014772081|nr:hypothetical protein [Pseudoalteromonas sp. NEC-BIFX-2020_002]NNG41826.1 hypothetical protein [Pseudoalteromonas sp. NEC-BIFX-2020_002]
MMNAVKRPWYQGSLNFWFKDLGCASYLIQAILATAACIIFIRVESLSTMMMIFAVVCAYCALAWQSIRMQATEWQCLVADYCKHVMFQGKVFIALINLTLLCGIALSPSLNNINMLLLANILGLSIWFICRVTSHLFTTCCYLAFTFAIIIPTFSEHLPLWLIPCSLLVLSLILLCKNKLGMPYIWQAGALINYRQGLQSGWSPVPSGFLSNYGTAINKQLFPLSYFVGSSLSQYIILLVLFSIIAIVINFFYNIAEHVLFALTLMLLAAVTLCQWAKAQRSQSWELLTTLPIYNGSHAVKVALSNSALKFSLLIGVLCFVSASILLLTHQQWQLLNVASYAIACIAATLTSFVLGNVFKNINVLSVLLCLSCGVSMGTVNVMIEHGDSILKLLLISLYASVLAVLNRFTIKYL